MPMHVAIRVLRIQKVLDKAQVLCLVVRHALKLANVLRFQESNIVWADVTV